MDEKFDDLLGRARLVKMTSQEREEQRRSFAFGNAKIDNDDVTRESIDREADRLNNE